MICARCGFPAGVNAPQSKSSTHRKERTAAESGLLLYPENPVLCRLGDSEFDDGLGWNLDLLLRLGIKASTCFPLLLYQLAKTRQDEFAVLFNLFVCERAERLEEYSSGSEPGGRTSRRLAAGFSRNTWDQLSVSQNRFRPLYRSRVWRSNIQSEWISHPRGCGRWSQDRHSDCDTLPGINERIA